MFLLRHAWELVCREPRRSAAAALGVAIGAGLLVSVVLFGTASGATVTRRALAGLPVDAQAVLAPGADPSSATRLLSSDPAVISTLPFDLVHFHDAATVKAGAATQTSDGVVVGIDDSYVATTDLFKLSQGRRAVGEIEVSRDLATNLGVTPGDSVTFNLPGGKSANLRISGIVDTTGADLLLGPIDAAHRAAGANPPTNVAVTDRATLNRLASLVPAEAASAGVGAPSGTPVVAVPERAVRHEIHVRYDHAQLPGNPADAQKWLDGVRRRLELKAAGTFTVADDASASLEPIAGDLAWGQILFIFLALPGVVLALTLSRFAADAAAEATRQHAALLRARGALQRQVMSVFVAAALITALMGAAIGALVGVAIAYVGFGTELRAAGSASAAVPQILVVIVGTAALATLAAAIPIRQQLSGEVAGERQQLQRGRRPFWQRFYLDLLGVAAGVVVFLLAGGVGVQPVLNAEGNPTVTLALTAFVAPLLLWTGGTLLLLRLVGYATKQSAWLVGVLRVPFRAGGELAGHSIVARAGAASRAIVLLGLAVSFAVSVLIFDATYRQQQHVDAELTLGADLRATPTSKVNASVVSMANGPGVGAVTPFVDRVVYVGSEAQDLLAIDPATLPATAPLADSFFQGNSAQAAMRALASQPNSVLVSAETATDYSLVVGDRINIRVPDAHGTLRQVEFRMAGVALEFPTAPKDAFLVANLSYVVQQTNDDAISYLLVRQTTDQAGAELQRRLGDGWSVNDLSTTNARLANGVTSVDLRMLVAIDAGFAILTASLGVALFLLAGLSERRRELATLRAIGADGGQMRAAVAAEASVVGVVGVVIGAACGCLVGLALLSILAGIFDPPPNLPVIPAASIGMLAATVAIALAVAVVVAARAIDRIAILAALRER